MAQGLKHIVMRDIVYHKFKTAYENGVSEYKLQGPLANEYKDALKVRDEIAKILLVNNIEQSIFKYEILILYSLHQIQNEFIQWAQDQRQQVDEKYLKYALYVVKSSSDEGI